MTPNLWVVCVLGLCVLWYVLYQSARMAGRRRSPVCGDGRGHRQPGRGEGGHRYRGRDEYFEGADAETPPGGVGLPAPAPPPPPMIGGGGWLVYDLQRDLPEVVGD